MRQTNDERAQARRRRGGGRLARRAAALLILAAAVAAGARFGLPALSGFLTARQVNVINLSIERRLAAIGELAVYSAEYSGETEVRSARRIAGIRIPGTTNSIRIAYSGTIKVGYEVSAIETRADPAAHTITVSLPEMIVVSNAIDEDSLQYVQNNNIFNPIRGDAAAYYLDEIRRSELEKAREAGIEDRARENAEAIIRESLSAFPDYEIVFRPAA